MTEPKRGWWRNQWGVTSWTFGLIPDAARPHPDNYAIMVNVRGSFYVTKEWFSTCTFLGDGPEPVEPTSDSPPITLQSLANHVERRTATLVEQMGADSQRINAIAKRMELVEAAIRSHDNRLRSAAISRDQQAACFGIQEGRIIALEQRLAVMAGPVLYPSQAWNAVLAEEPAPEPFRVTGLGVYRRRDGGTEEVISNDEHTSYPWNGRSGESYTDKGTVYVSIETIYDLVARIGDLPEVPA